MPEGPEVKRTSELLNQLYAGKTIVDINFDTKSRYYISDERRANPSLVNKAQWTILQKFTQGFGAFKSKLPLKILRIYARGKKIFFELQHEVTLVSFFGMEGRWEPRLPEGPRKHSNLWLTLSDGTYLDFNDSRHMGSIEFIFNEVDLKRKLEEFGPDILQDEITPEIWTRIIRNNRIRNKPLCEFLLEQERISGIGNYLRAEIMYRAQVRPDRPIGELTDEEIERVRIHSIGTSRESYENSGCSIYTYKDPLGKDGHFKCQVYGQTVDPYGNEVLTFKDKDNRMVHWVPAVQDERLRKK